MNPRRSGSTAPIQQLARRVRAPRAEAVVHTSRMAPWQGTYVRPRGRRHRDCDRGSWIARLSGLSCRCRTGHHLEGIRDEWRWSITPYLWGSDIDTDVRFPGGQEIGGTAKFDDILDKLDFGGMVHFEGQRGAWGMFVDATYLTLSDDTTQGPISVDSELDTGLYEFAATYTPGGESGRVHCVCRCAHR